MFEVWCLCLFRVDVTTTRYLQSYRKCSANADIVLNPIKLKEKIYSDFSSSIFLSESSVARDQMSNSTWNSLYILNLLCTPSFSSAIFVVHCFRIFHSIEVYFNITYLYIYSDLLKYYWRILSLKKCLNHWFYSNSKLRH